MLTVSEIVQLPLHSTVVKRTSTLSDFAGLASAFNSRDLIFMWYNVLIYVYNIYELEAAEATFLRPYLFHIFSSYSN